MLLTIIVGIVCLLIGFALGVIEGRQTPYAFALRDSAVVAVLSELVDRIKSNCPTGDDIPQQCRTMRPECTALEIVTRMHDRWKQQ